MTLVPPALINSKGIAKLQLGSPGRKSRTSARSKRTVTGAVTRPVCRSWDTAASFEWPAGTPGEHLSVSRPVWVL